MHCSPTFGQFVPNFDFNLYSSQDIETLKNDLSNEKASTPMVKVTDAEELPSAANDLKALKEKNDVAANNGTTQKVST